MNRSETRDKEVQQRGVVVDCKDLPMTILYKGRKYILILTKNDKLILNKYEE